MRATRNEIGESEFANWQGIHIRWPGDEERFTPDLQQRDRMNRAPATAPATTIQFTWLAAVSAGSTTTANSREMIFTTEAQRKKF